MHILDKKKRGRYLLGAALLLLILVLLIKVWTVTAPFFIALLLAYLLNSPYKKMLNLGIPAAVALVVLYLYLFIALYFLLVITVPLILEQLRNLFAYLPQVLSSLNSFLAGLAHSGASGAITIDFQQIADGIVASLDERIAAYSAKIADMLFSLPQLLLYLVLTPILSYYFLRDREQIKQRLTALVSPSSRPELCRVSGEIDHLVREFINGYLVIALMVAIIAAVFYWIIGLDYPVVLGILMGLGDLIPYFGPVIAAIPAVLLALTISPAKAVIVIIGILLLQQLDSSVITPRVIGDRIGLHPVATIFAVMAGGHLWGITGAVFAIPLAAVILLLIKYICGRVFASDAGMSP